MCRAEGQLVYLPSRECKAALASHIFLIIRSLGDRPCISRDLIVLIVWAVQSLMALTVPGLLQDLEIPSPHTCFSSLLSSPSKC